MTPYLLGSLSIQMTPYLLGSSSIQMQRFTFSNMDRCYSVYYHGLGGPPDQASSSLGVDPQTRTLVL